MRKLFVFLIISSLFFNIWLGAALAALDISNGRDATGVVGQYEDDTDDPLVPTYTGLVSNIGLDGVVDVEVDTVNHRLYIADGSNYRVLVHTLDANNDIIDYIPDYVLGQTDFTARSSGFTQSTFSDLNRIELDVTGNRLFVADEMRVLVFDVATITNGEDAAYVIGATTFTSSTKGSTQSLMENNLEDLAFDPDTNYLYVLDNNNNRVMVFDVVSITNGENAVYVLGQANFTANDYDTTQSTLTFPEGIAIDSTGNRLFVADSYNYRVMVFDTTTLSNGENAVNVLGQVDFVTNNGGTSQSLLNYPTGLEFDSNSSRLFVSDTDNSRVLVFDVTAITDGETATYVLGQADFTSSAYVTTQSSTKYPRGLAFGGTDLYVADNGSSRIIIFDVSAISNGENAVNVIGQYTGGAGEALAISYTSSKTNHIPNSYRFGQSSLSSAIDTVNHRLYVTDFGLGRVLVYDLNVNNMLTDYVADYVLGKSDFVTSGSTVTQSNTVSPMDVLVDSDNNLLYVADPGGRRILVYDVATISNGENAAYVLGQANFTTSSSTASQSVTPYPYDLALDSTNDLLYVADLLGNRIMVFDVATIVNGENAAYVLGQTTFTATSSGITQAKLQSPTGVALDSTTNLLYVADRSNNRVMVFDVASITNGENAVNVLGPSTFTSGSATTTQSTFNSPRGVAIDSTNDLLFVSDYTNNRVMVFDVASITNGENAAYVLGKSTFVSSTAQNTQSGITGPEGIAYVASTETLYVSGGRRVLIYDLTDVTAPVISAVTAVTTPTNDTTPNYTFTTNEAGTISYGGSCTSATTSAVSGSNTITFSALAEGTYTNCTITVTDAGSNASNVLSVASFTVDATAPVISEVTSIGTTIDTTPTYVFTTDEAGTISYGGSCTSNTTSATSGENTVSFTTLSLGSYSNCTVTVTDAAGNASNVLSISSFSVIAYGAVSVAFLQNISNNIIQQESKTEQKEILGCTNNTKYSPQTGDRCPDYKENTCTKVPLVPRVLRTGMSHASILDLQKALNCKGYMVSTAGPGSVGKETNKFGKATREAVIKLQKFYGLKPDGVVGDITRNILNQ